MPNPKKEEISRRTLLKTGVWFSLFNVCIILLLSTRYIALIPEVSANPFYLFSLVTSHFVFLSFFPFFFLYLPVTILTRNKKKSMIAAAVGATILLLLLLIDSYVFTLYRFHINKYVIEQVFGPDASQVFELAFVQYLLVGGVLALLVIVEVWLFRMAFRVANRCKILYLYLICGLFAVLGLFAQIVHAWGEATGDRTITGLDKYFPLCTPLNANKLLSTVGVKVEKDILVTDFKNKEYTYPKETLRTSSSGKNILVIAIDSWHYRMLDSIISPNLHQFAKRSSQFTRHYSGSNGTRTGVFSLFYGLPGVYWDDFCKQKISPVIIEELKTKNYDIKLFPSASLYNPTLDKNVFVSVPEQCAAEKGMNAWQRDRNLTDRFFSFLQNRNKNSNPFFSFLFYDSLHSMILPEGYKGPFQPSWTYPKYESLGKNVDPTLFLNLYKNMNRYLDDLFGEIIQKMEEQNLLENTIILITGDHGQEFDDNKQNFWGHNGNFSDAQIRVPLIYYTQEREPAVYSHWTSHYDIVPTLMEDAFNAQNQATDYSIGKSLFNESDREFLLVDSYIALGIIDTSGQIANIYYDGKYEILDKNLNELPDAKLNTRIYNEALKQITSFYKEK